MGDAAVAASREKHHLVFPRVRAERPPVAENHGPSAAPVLVVDLRAVRGRDRAHAVLSLVCGGRRLSDSSKSTTYAIPYPDATPSCSGSNRTTPPTSRAPTPEASPGPSTA